MESKLSEQRLSAENPNISEAGWRRIQEQVDGTASTYRQTTWTGTAEIGSAISQLRKNLKIWLLSKRSLESAGPTCCICGEPIKDGACDMHEVILTRGDAQRVEHEGLLYRPENCVLIHNGECHNTAQHTQDGEFACVTQILIFEGYGNVQLWLNEMENRFKSSLEQQRYLVNYVATGIHFPKSVKNPMGKAWSFGK